MNRARKLPDLQQVIANANARTNCTKCGGLGFLFPTGDTCSNCEASKPTKLVNTTKFSAMAEFRRRTKDRTSFKNILMVLNDVAGEYNVTAVCRQGALYPNVYTLGFKDEQGREVTEAFNT